MPQAANILPSAEYLHQCFEYDAETGDLRWKQRPREHFKSTRSFKVTTTRYAGRIAGSLHKHGYLLVHFDGKEVHASRIIYKMHHLVDPEFIDHIDRNRRNNRIENLRSATNTENVRNRSQQISIHGLAGVRRQDNKFQARISMNGKYIHLGTFATVEAAHASYQEAANRLFGEFSRFHKR